MLIVLLSPPKVHLPRVATGKVFAARGGAFPCEAPVYSSLCQPSICGGRIGSSDHRDMGSFAICDLRFSKSACLSPVTALVICDWSIGSFANRFIGSSFFPSPECGILNLRSLQRAYNLHPKSRLSNPDPIHLCSREGSRPAHLSALGLWPSLVTHHLSLNTSIFTNALYFH